MEILVERVRTAGESTSEMDALAVEEPLAIQLCGLTEAGKSATTISITMRTPGHDAELAIGFLFAEGIIHGPADVERVELGDSGDSVRIRLAGLPDVDLTRSKRHAYATSSCGFCGKTSLDALHTSSRYPLEPGEPAVGAELIGQLPQALRAAQPTFGRTGGLHAAALFDTRGELCRSHEDIGRHNAVDKLIGAELLAGRIPAGDRILVVSGRAGFELVQKAAMAGVPILVAIGAPSSLAVELATCTGMTLVGFARPGGFNVYTGFERCDIESS